MYHGLEARLHDFFWDAEGEGAELPLIEHFLKHYPGTTLELGCGSGRLLLPLLEKGFLIEGLDNSAEMLGLCRARAHSLEPLLHEASMEDFQTGSIYGSITIPAFTIQLLDPENITATLSNIARHLHPGGGLYLTMFIPWAELTGELEQGIWFLEREAAMPAGNIARCHTRFHIRRLSQMLSREHRYEILDARAQVLESSTSTQNLSWFWPREIKRLLADAGFVLHELIGDFSPDIPCDDDSQIITCIASLGTAITPTEATSP